MPISSDWILTKGSSRFLLPRFLSESLSKHELSRELYPTAFGYYRTAKNHRMQRLVHEDLLMIYCTQGKGFLKIQGTSYSITAGTFLILPKGLAHEYGADSAQPWSIYWVHFSGTHAEQFVDMLELKNETQVLDLGLHAKLISDFENLLETRQSGYSLKPFIHASNQLRQILSYLSLLITKTKSKQHKQIDLERVHALMMENLHGHLDLEALATSANLSKFHFSKKYKTLTGNTPIQHFIHLKMEQACYLLDISEKPISEIASLLDYEDSHYFSRLFKKVIGISASEYREGKVL